MPVFQLFAGRRLLNKYVAGLACLNAYRARSTASSIDINESRHVWIGNRDWSSLLNLLYKKVE